MWVCVGEAVCELACKCFGDMGAAEAMGTAEYIQGFGVCVCVSVCVCAHVCMQCLLSLCVCLCACVLRHISLCY